MSFDLARWRDDTREQMTAFAQDPRGTLQRTGVTSLYGFLLGSSILPLAAAYATDPGTAVIAASGIVGSVGAGLLTNLVQKRYDDANAIARAAEDTVSPALAPAYEAIAKQLDIIKQAELALKQAGQDAVIAELRAELQRLGKAGQFSGANITIEQSGGVNFGVGNTFGSVGDVIGGDKVMGDKVNGDKHIHYGAPKPATDDPAHLQGLLDDTIKRLQVLERQAAQFGIYTPPYVQTGIDDARREVARLKALLEKK